MELTLANFKQILYPTILQRGRAYHAAGRVVDLERVDAGFWLAIVRGTSSYRVEVSSSQDGAIRWECQCPYDRGPVCKHVAAVLFAIEESATAPNSESADNGERPKSSADQLREALAPLSRDQLYEILFGRALSDRELAHLILTRFGSGQDEKESATSLINEALALGVGRHGYIDYSGAGRAAAGVRRVLGRAHIFLEQGQPARAVPTYQAVIEVVAPAMEQADDSNGALGGCIEFALEGLRVAARQLPPEEQARLFDYCIAEGRSNRHAGWDRGWDLLLIAADLAATPAQRGALYTALDDVLAGSGKTDWSAEYEQQRAAGIKLGLIRLWDGDAAAERFMEQNIRLVNVRLGLARIYLQRGEPAAARRLCREWLDQPHSRMPGLRRNFLDILLEAAEAEHDRPEQIRLAEELFMDTGRLDYYQRLKQLVGPAQWQAYQPGFLRRTERAPRWIDLGALYSAEEMWAELLAHVEQNPRNARQFHKELAGRFPEELGAVYERLAIETVEQKANRAGYHEACAYLRIMQELGQGERAARLVAQWRSQYRQKRALQDELNQAFGR